MREGPLSFSSACASDDARHLAALVDRVLAGGDPDRELDFLMHLKGAYFYIRNHRRERKPLDKGPAIAEPLDRLLEIKEVAVQMKVSVPTARLYVKNGILPKVPWGRRRYRVPESAVKTLSRQQAET